MVHDNDGGWLLDSTVVGSTQLKIPVGRNQRRCCRRHCCNETEELLLLLLIVVIFIAPLMKMTTMRMMWGNNNHNNANITTMHNKPKSRWSSGQQQPVAPVQQWKHLEKSLITNGSNMLLIALHSLRSMQLYSEEPYYRLLTICTALQLTLSQLNQQYFIPARYFIVCMDKARCRVVKAIGHFGQAMPTKTFTKTHLRFMNDWIIDAISFLLNPETLTISTWSPFNPQSEFWRQQCIFA